MVKPSASTFSLSRWVRSVYPPYPATGSGTPDGAAGRRSHAKRGNGKTGQRSLGRAGRGGRPGSQVGQGRGLLPGWMGVLAGIGSLLHGWIGRLTEGFGSLNRTMRSLNE